MASSFPSLEGKYEVLEKLHEGGMGAVYKVRHRLLDEIRVIKVMRPQFEADAGLRARFLREAQMAVKLRHPHIAQMFDFAFDESGRGFIVMEYVEGISLQQLLERAGAPSLGLALDLARQALEAIAFLHKRGIVHRDISPDNIMATTDEEGRTVVKLIDLGIAKVMAAGTGLTGTGTFLGKLRYASPEQFGVNGATIDPRTDVYSFGVVLYELLTGTHPLPGESPHEIIAGHLVKPPVAFDVSDPTGRLPADLRAAVLRAMAKRPDDRFARAEDLDAALAAIQPRFPPAPDELARAVLQGTEPTTPIRVPPSPGSTQARIDAQFGMGATPGPIPLVGGAPGTGAAPTTALPGTGAGAAPPAPPSAGTGAAVPAPAAAGTAPPAQSAPEGGVPAGTQPTVILPSAPPKPAPARAGAPGRRLALLGAAAALVVGIVITGWALLRRPVAPAPEATAPAQVATAPVPAAVEPPSGPSPVAPPTGETGAAGALEGAIASGSPGRIRAALAAMSGAELQAMDATPEGRRRLEVARRVAGADAALAKATRAKDWPAAVERASALAAILPSSPEARLARESAAASLEGEADALVRKGQGEAALAMLHALQRSWPDRPGLEARLTGVRTAHEADQRFAAALAAAEAAEKARRPEQGLEALARLKPDPRWSDRFAAARGRLETLLAELDKAPPSLRLKPGAKLEYSRGKAVTLQFLVTDDYRVKDVTVMARREGAPEFQTVSVKAVGGDEYDVEIAPELHDNKTVEVYVVAVDLSGHVAKLGTPEKPILVKKRFLFF